MSIQNKKEDYHSNSPRPNPEKDEKIKYIFSPEAENAEKNPPKKKQIEEYCYSDKSEKARPQRSDKR